MGMLHENSSYPAVKTKDPFRVAGEVWETPAELRDFETEYGPGDFYVIPILPKGAARAEENVVSLWVKTGSRLSELSKTIKAAGADDIEPGDLIACRFDGETRKGKKGDIKVWRFEFQKGRRSAPAGSLLGDASADTDGDSGSLLGD